MPDPYPAPISSTSKWNQWGGPPGLPFFALPRADIQHLEMEPVGRKQGHRMRAQVRPRLVGAMGHRGAQVEQELVGKAVDGRRLAKGEPQAHGPLQGHAACGNPLVLKQRDEAGAARVRPNVRMQELPQHAYVLERDLALADPLEDGIPP